MIVQDPIAEAKRLARRAAEKRYRDRHRERYLTRRAKFREKNRERLRVEATEYNRKHGVQPRPPKRAAIEKPPRIIADPIVANLVKGARDRAREKGYDFNLKASSLTIPAVCPVLGIPLAKVPGKVTPGTPSLDRRDNSGGYTLDNVRIISYRANTLKSNGTLEEFKAIIKYMERA